jgi:hypothetical protein
MPCKRGKERDGIKAALAGETVPSKLDLDLTLKLD